MNRIFNSGAMYCSNALHLLESTNLFTFQCATNANLHEHTHTPIIEKSTREAKRLKMPRPAIKSGSGRDMNPISFVCKWTFCLNVHGTAFFFLYANFVVFRHTVLNYLKQSWLNYVLQVFFSSSNFPLFPLHSCFFCLRLKRTLVFVVFVRFYSPLGWSRCD